MNELTRRELLRRLMALGFSATGASALLSAISCSSPPAPASPAAAATGTATQFPPTATPVPPAATGTGVPTTATATGVPATVTAGATAATATGTPPSAGQAYLAVARGDSPAAIVAAALKALGGIERFVKPGADVIVKPNICVAYRAPEYAATTNPEVVGTLVRLCLGAGAKRVRVLDNPFGGTAQQAYTVSGIGPAVERAGGEMVVMMDAGFRQFDIPVGQSIKKWTFYKDVLDADVIIDVPIAKTHGDTRLTLGMKNLMGVVENRNGMHADLARRIADVTSRVRPHLTVIDAVRILTKNGPTGGSLNWVKQMNMVIASHDIVAADAYGTTLFAMKPADIGYIKAAAAMGLGTMDLKAVKVEEIAV